MTRRCGDSSRVGVRDRSQRGAVGLSNAAGIQDTSWPEQVDRSSPAGETDRIMSRSPTGPESASAGTWIERCAPDDLAARYGTPFYVYDFDLIEHRVDALRCVLPPVAEVAYAVKANPALSVVAHLGRLRVGADVASRGELELAVRAGITPDRIVMTGPGKRDDELRQAVVLGIRAVTVESPAELARLEAIAAEAGRIQPVMLRAATSGHAGLERVRLVGDAGAGKFGMDAADLIEAAWRASRSPHLDLLGLHSFGASNVLDAEILLAHVEATVSAARRLAVATGTRIRLVDVGGGLGIPYADHEEPLDLERLGAGLAAITAAWVDDPVLAEARLLLEPGRFLVGPAGAYVARVVDRKTVDGSAVVILDGGVHHVLRPALTRQEHRVRALGAPGAPGSQDGRLGSREDAPRAPRRRATEMRPVTIAGPLCSGLDIFCQGFLMRPPEVGELVAVLDVGAYGFTESMPLFLSHPIPAEVAVRGGRAELIRPRVEPSTWLAAQIAHDW